MLLKKATSAMVAIALFSSLAYATSEKGVKREGHYHIHPDGTYCNIAHPMPFYFIYNKKDNSFVEFDRMTFVKPHDFTPSKEEKALRAIEKKFHASQSDPKYKNTKVTNIATTPKSNPDLIYLIAEPLE